MRRLARSLLLVALVVALPTLCVADPVEQGRLEGLVNQSANELAACCASPEVWRYDNLRPTVNRAVAPLGTIFRPPEVPVVHLSPASPDYRRVVGQIMYYYARYESRRQRLADYMATQKKGDQPVIWRAPRPDVIEEGFDEDSSYVENELDQAAGSYGRACAWAWPYTNLRPMCPQKGFEAATILNPLVASNPGIRLSGPAYNETVMALGHWGPRMAAARLRQQDLQADRLAATAAQKALADNRAQAAPDDRGDPARQADMAALVNSLVSAMRQWRKCQHKIEAQAEPWFITNCNLAAIQFQTQQLQANIAARQLDRRNDDQVAGAAFRAQTQALCAQLNALVLQAAAVQRELESIEREMQSLQADQARFVAESDVRTEQWVALCDPLGRLGPKAHERAVAWFNQWITEEPRLWQLYLARGIASLHAGRNAEAMSDLGRAGDKVLVFDARPQARTFIISVQAYTLCKTGDTRNGEKRFAEARRSDIQSWVPHYFRGWSYLEYGDYAKAKNDLQLAVRNTKQPQPYEAMALLLAACPKDEIRNGKKALEHAAKASQLMQQPDWICLGTMAAAQAEAGNFDEAIRLAEQSLEAAPKESHEPILDRIAGYRERKPYRLEK